MTTDLDKRALELLPTKYHEELAVGLVEGKPLFEEQQEWVKAEDALRAIKAALSEAEEAKQNGYELGLLTARPTIDVGRLKHLAMQYAQSCVLAAVATDSRKKNWRVRRRKELLQRFLDALALIDEPGKEKRDG